MAGRVETTWFTVQFDLDVVQTKDPGMFVSTYGGYGMPSMAQIQKRLDEISGACTDGGWIVRSAIPINGFAYNGSSNSEVRVPFTIGIAVLAQREVGE